MNLFFEGVKIGLVLCFLFGPIFFTIIQTSIEEGIWAGTVVGFGVWVSDMLYITTIYWGLSHIIKITEWQNFPIALGIIGGAILLLFGIGTLYSKTSELGFENHPIRTSSYFSLFSKGFLVNGINPFTLFFWIGVSSTVLVKESMDGYQAFAFFSGIIVTIIVTDFIKILLAKSIRKFMRPVHLFWTRKIIGILLIIFGVILVARIFAHYLS